MHVPEYPAETILSFTTVPLKLGFGAADEVGYEAKRLEAKRALICTDKNLRATGHPDRIQKIIEKEGIGAEIYDDIHVEPTDKSIDKVANELKGNEFDLYVAVGGGSTIDTTKAVSLLITYPAPVMEYVNKPIGHAKSVPGPLKPLLVLPTTSGTGSETTPVSVLDILDMKVKTGISHPFLRPTMALLDPLLTVSMSPQITASTGMDVLTHALESYTSLPFDKRKRPDHPSQRAAYIGANVLCDIFCVKAIEIVGRYLRRAVADPYDLEARWHMMVGSTLAGIGFGNAGVHIPHSMAYPIGGMVRNYRPPGYKVEKVMVPHGQAVTITAPPAFRFTAPVWPEKHAYGAQLLGLNNKDMPVKEAAMALSDEIIELMKDIGFPNGLSEMGFTEADIPQIVDGTLKQQRLLVGCPRQVGEKELTQIAQEAMKYW
jgi:hydroxyacid-oxoacid transhydrogenase